MALTASRHLDSYPDQQVRTFRVKGSTTVYKGALVGITAAGYARGLVAGDRFAGVAYEEMANAGADGAKTVRVYTSGDYVHPLTGAVQADAGRPVFASADGTLVFTGAGNSYVGVAQDYSASNEIILRIDPLRRMVKTVTYQVPDLGAGTDFAARAIHSFNQEAWIVSARVVNQETAAAGIDASNTCVVALVINAGAVASQTFDATPAFPDANTVADLGAITNGHAAAGDVLTLAVTNGATANPGLFLVEVDYV